MNKIRIGIICPSEIAFRRFLPSLQLAEGFEYVGVAIASKKEFVGATDEILAKERQKAQTFVDSYGGKIFEGYETMITSNEIDAIYLPLPPALHFKWAEKALLNNKHVFVEKPFLEIPPDWDKEEKMWKSGELFTYFADWKVERIAEVIFEDNSGGIPHYHCMDTIICRKVT